MLGTNVGRIARIVVDPIGYASRIVRPSTGLMTSGPDQFTARSLATIPVTAGAYGLAGMSAFAPEPTAQQAAEAEAINQQAQARGMMTLTPYEAQLLEQQMVFQEQAKQERDAIRQMVARRQETLAQEQAMATQGARQQQMNQYLQQRGY